MFKHKLPKNFISTITIALLLFTVICYAGKDKIQQSGAYDEAVSLELSSAKSGVLAWGLRRAAEGQQPIPNPGSPEMLAKYDAKYIGDIKKKVVYLTFDEGYENGHSNQILDVLKQDNVKAIFFITGPYLSTEQGLVRRMITEGHSVGNHTVHHPSLPTISKDKMVDELSNLEKDFYEIFHKKMDFMRPPKGEYDETVLDVARKMNYCTLFWSFAYDDWDVKKVRGKDYAVKKVCENIHPGAVLLLHATSKDNADALDEIIKTIRSKGYEFGQPSDLYTIKR